MEKIVLLFVCLAVFINAGFALRCYHCSSDKMDDCSEGASGNQKVSCGLEHPQILQFCLRKTVYDKQQEKKMYVSTCESFRKPIGREFNKDVPVPESIIVLDRNILQCQPNATHNVEKCEPCRENLCNAFPNSAPKLSIFNFLYLPVFYFLVKVNLS